MLSDDTILFISQHLLFFMYAIAYFMSFIKMKNQFYEVKKQSFLYTHRLAHFLADNMHWGTFFFSIMKRQMDTVE